MTLFWIIAGLMAAAIAGLLALALLRGQRETGASEKFDISVYKDQLKEIDRDLARGTLPEAEAERLRTEISRRLLAADARATSDAADAQQPKMATRGLAAFSVVLILGGSYALYAQLGAPGYRDLPLQDRIAAAAQAMQTRRSQSEAEAQIPAQITDAPADYAALVDRLRSTLAERPDDLRGLGLLARSEASMGNFTAAYAAIERIIEVKGPEASAEDYADLTDMMVLAAGGYVSPEAQAVLEQALERDPNNGVASYYAGLMLAQTGRPDMAFRTWDRLLRTSPAGAPWLPPIYEQIEELAFRAGVSNYSLPQPAQSGPTAADLEAASELSLEERMEMVRGMVSGLAERLGSEGGPPQDWARLISSLMVLGQAEQAQAILGEALQIFAETPDALEILRQTATRSGLDVTEQPGPTAEDIEAAQDMAPEDRMAMIRGMVDGLAARLAEDGGPPQDWARLISSLSVLGETDRATAILGEARAVFADLPDALNLINGAAAQAGLQ